MKCPNCGKEVEGQWVDTGIGSYEYWGSKDTDIRNEFICENCNETLETEDSYADYVSDMKEEFGRNKDDYCE